jgi:hypothetical protein
MYDPSPTKYARDWQEYCDQAHAIHERAARIRVQVDERAGF